MAAYTTIDDPSAYFQTTLYTGNGGTLAVTNGGNSDLQPDWLWLKKRNGSVNHFLFDVVRGSSKELNSNNAEEEASPSNYLSSFNSDGFTIGSDSDINGSSDTHVAWQWKAGGSASNNTDGNTTTSASVNQTAGFSIMKWAGDGNESTIGHGLGAEPEYIIFKEIDGGESWRVWSKHTPDTASKALALNLSDGAFSQTNWIGTISSSIITIGSDSSINTSGNNYIGYAFAPKQGYSKFGSYTGNANADGTFVFTGFKPAWLLIKQTGAAGKWLMIDNKRDPGNACNHRLNADVTNAENTNNDFVDMLSNGWKFRTTDDDYNTSGVSGIYMAFAENPFVTSGGVPATAR